jgi:drug/metabolite transporter (DMT)-like permease
MNRGNSDPVKGFLYSLGGALLVSTNFVTAKYALQGFNPETFSLVWTCAASVYSFAILLVGGARRDQIFPMGSMKPMLALGITTGLCMVLAWKGLAVLDSAFASFLWRFFPVLTICCAAIFLKERLSVLELFAMAIMLLGAFWSMDGRWEGVGRGAILTILAGCAGAAQLLIAKSQTDRHHPNVLVAYRVGIASFFIACWVFATGNADFAVEAGYWYVTLLGAFLGPCASFLLTFRAYRYWTLSQSSIVLTAQPLLVLPLAYVFLGSFPTPRELTGGSLILAGAFWLAAIQVLRAKKSRPRFKRKSDMRSRFLTYEKAKEKHPDAHIELRYRGVDSTYPGHENVPVSTIPAIFVWPDKASSQDDDGVNCIAVYWLREEN